VSDGTRTHDRLDHNQELYQLSYAHRGMDESTSDRRSLARGRAARPGAVSALALGAVSVVIEMERVADAPPQTGEVPMVARAPEHDQRGAENDEPDHIV
jgi:hypothetical protein